MKNKIKLEFLSIGMEKHDVLHFILLMNTLPPIKMRILKEVS